MIILRAAGNIREDTTMSAGWTEIRLVMQMNDRWCNRTGALCGLGGVYYPAHEATAGIKMEVDVTLEIMTSEHKKSRTLPMRVRVGPTKNLLQRRTEKRPARHKDTMVPCWYSNLWSKRAILILGRFTRTFAEITNEMSLELTLANRREPFQRVIYIVSRKSQACFPLFSDYLCARRNLRSK